MVSKLRSSALAWAPLLGYMGLIFGLSSMSHPPIPQVDVPNFDKVLHLIEYCGLGALICRAVASRGLSPRGCILATVLTGSLFGASDELHQWFVPGRSCELLDWTADTLGSLLGASAYGLVFLKRKPRPVTA